MGSSELECLPIIGHYKPMHWMEGGCCLSSWLQATDSSLGECCVPSPGEAADRQAHCLRHHHQHYGWLQ